ncbi:HlyD family efflux transporter periplasmic adaptor subunit [Sulfurimonas lithotrophica]|uniref:HlyD family efflux transporter periplasmic adaptor subunit n=1 Tax=Sulfurimonas lithotrophica TaxID=2590022 RepID=A0A5P8P0G3_9BACT|nr:HlyD family efflux transporter periplasmic adaptor subunit [Sulfurimonas lithotrophica]QFR49090.1 HlyD family efflux transporter periplasmic adaptor subunit [Sulfurimonas lithotrophica]
MNKSILKKVFLGVLIVGGFIVYYMMENLNSNQLPDAFVFGNGRLEMTEVDIATKYPGRVKEVLVQEGDMVSKGQLMAKLDTKELEAKLKQTKAMVEQAVQQKEYAKAIVAQRKSELLLAKKNLERSKSLYINKNISLVQLQQDETKLISSNAALEAAKAQVVSADASIEAAKAQVETIKVNIEESNLFAPIEGRVLYKLVEPGEIVGSGTKLYTLLDLSDTYMTIFLPTADAGRVAINTQARIVVDAMPNMPIPAFVSFVSPEAQFTPKEIETEKERAKLMFRIKVKVDFKMFNGGFKNAKSGLPGISYVRLDDSTPWPNYLQVKKNNKIVP